MNRSPGEEKINHFQFHETEHFGLAKTVSELPWYLTSKETTRLIRDGERGGMEVGGDGDYIYYIYLSLLCQHQNDW